MDPAPGVPGVSNGQGPLNKLYEVWCANIAPKMKKIRNNLRKQGFFLHFFSILMIFRSLRLFVAILKVS